MEKKLIKLMNENPDIPVIPMVNSKVCAGAEGYWMGIIGQCELSECVMLEISFNRIFFSSKYGIMCLSIRCL